MTSRSRAGRRYDWIRDSQDARDFFYRAMRPESTLPQRVDLRPLMSPVEDQGDLGSCTANAIAGAMEFLENKAGARPFVDISRLFIYYQERSIEHTVRQDAGAMIRDGVKACAKVGACSELLWPYVISKFTARPPKKAYADAAKRKISEYRRIASLGSLRACLADGFPVVIGITVYESFESEEVARTGRVEMPGSGERELGGHAVLVVGYDQAQKRLIVRNSWGAGWGGQGYFTLPYTYVSSRNLADDFWTIRKEATQ